VENKAARHTPAHIQTRRQENANDHFQQQGLGKRLDRVLKWNGWWGQGVNHHVKR